ncbi:putative reverse transcriptase domain-containing protein [Tanacetum coccineum]
MDARCLRLAICAEDDKVKFAMCTFEGRALTWWNGNVQTLGLANANQIPWSNVKAMMTTEYCPATKIQRMEQELWTLTLKGDDIESLQQSFPRNWLDVRQENVRYASAQLEERFMMEIYQNVNRSATLLIMDVSSNVPEMSKIRSHGKGLMMVLVRESLRGGLKNPQQIPMWSKGNEAGKDLGSVGMYQGDEKSLITLQCCPRFLRRWIELLSDTSGRSNTTGKGDELRWGDAVEQKRIDSSQDEAKLSKDLQAPTEWLRGDLYGSWLKRDISGTLADVLRALRLKYPRKSEPQDFFNN